jgi:hypothetical protein
MEIAMKNVFETVKFAATFVLVFVAAASPDMAASREGTAPTVTGAGTTALHDAKDSRPLWDGSRQLPGNSQIGAAPDVFAITAGVTCNFLYVVRNGKRVKEKHCEDTR